MARIPFVIPALAAAVAAQGEPLLEKLQAAAAEHPLVVAHRGSSASHPENTIAAFRAAVTAGADIVELDVYQTKDGHWVCFHDKTLDRTTDAVQRLGRGKTGIADLTLAEVETLDAGSWKSTKFVSERIPTLAQALAVIQPAAVPMVERKQGDPQALVAELRRLEVTEDVIVQAFDWSFLTAVHRAEPKLLLGALGSGPLTEIRRDAAVLTGAAIVHWQVRDLTVESAAATRDAGWLLGAYTANQDADLLGAAAIGCRFITTDRPARLVELRRRGLPAPR